MAAASCRACGFPSADPEREGERAAPPLPEETGSGAGLVHGFPSTQTPVISLQPAMPKEEFFVNMTCTGCSDAVTRVLSRLGDVQYEIDLPNKKVVIQSDNHSVDQLLETLKKTGKEARHLSSK
ncbi:copper transport protein ATOX1 [Bufo gargarizans]|uniref:copper transport protein ATOX1 n=1 Tax=Bufo gargarizans TaxID=30331 RepID=UPI001CF180BC|nr:copper transport protein ATOX1 [Bufo gargarizans]